MTLRLHAPALVALLLLACGSAQAQDEVTVLAPGGARTALSALVAGFEAKSGYKVKLDFGSGLVTKKQIADGVDADVPVAQPPFPEILASGNVDVKSQTPLAYVSVALAVKKGTPKPDISTPAALKAAIMAAKSVSYPDPSNGAAAGVTIEKMLADLGFDKQDPKFIHAKGGVIAMQMVAAGTAEIGFTFASEMDTPGIDQVGAPPATIAPPTALVGFVSTHAKNPKGAKALLAYMASPDGAKIFREQGLVPGAP